MELKLALVLRAPVEIAVDRPKTIGLLALMADLCTAVGERDTHRTGQPGSFPKARFSERSAPRFPFGKLRDRR